MKVIALPSIPVIKTTYVCFLSDTFSLLDDIHQYPIKFSSRIIIFLECLKSVTIPSFDNCLYFAFFISSRSCFHFGLWYSRPVSEPWLVLLFNAAIRAKKEIILSRNCWRFRSFFLL